MKRVILSWFPFKKEVLERVSPQISVEKQVYDAKQIKIGLIEEPKNML